MSAAPESQPKDGGRHGPGALVLVCGPSGAGKDTLLRRVAEWRRADPNVIFARRVVTRPASDFEDNESVSDAAFETMAAGDAFAFWWAAHGHKYGISSSINADIGRGCCVVANVSRLIVDSVRDRYERVVAVMVTASPDTLRHRLALRGRASDSDIGQRIARTKDVADRFRADTVISNDGAIDAAARALADVIETQIRTTKRGGRSVAATG